MEELAEALWLKAVVGEFVLWHRPALGLNWLCWGWCQAAPAGLVAQGPRAAKLSPVIRRKVERQLCAQAVCDRSWFAFLSLVAVKQLFRVSHSRAVLFFHPTPLVCLHWPQSQAAG